MSVIPFPQRPRTYCAQAFEAHGFGPRIELAGTLDGYIDMAFIEPDGSHVTWQIDRDKARSLIAALHGVCQDIEANCLFDRDGLLEAGG